MANHGMLRNYRFSDTAEDIRGSKVYGLNDEKLGKIDDVIFDYATGEITYVVVDTGGWLTSKKFVVPVEQLRQSIEHEDDFSVNLNKQQIESFPPYDEGDLESDAKWSDYEGRYRSKWETGPVMHRAETDRNITPTTQQMKSSGLTSAAASGATAPDWGAGSEAADAAAASLRTERVVPAGSDSVVISNSANGIGDRWDTFQSRLRERRKEVVGTGSAQKQGAESTETLRKAV
jgi:sporulation protein YlmC with PRC-barrel domain